MPTEAIIRDHLAAHLHLIEHGLRLIRVEYPVANPDGAAGKIDILAQDSNRMLVVIEVKRSDKSARETIQELEKYTSLLLTQEGYGPSQVRCIIISTHWHELLTPYSQFTRHAPYTIDGYKIEQNELGDVLTCTRVQPLARGQQRAFCPHHFVLCFDTPAQIDQGTRAIQAALAEIDVENYLLATFEPKPRYRRDLSPHLLYIVIEVLPESSSQKFERAYEELQRRHGPEEYSDPEWSREDAALAWACDRLPHSLRSDAEIGYPEKLSEVRSTYCLKQILRSGRLLQAKDTLTDEALLTEAEGHADGRSPQFTSEMNTRHVAARLSFCDAARDCLGKNVVWRAGFDWAMAQIPEGGNWHVKGNLVNTMNFVGQFYACMREQDMRYLPSFQLYARDNSSNYGMYIEGAVCWNGNPVRGSFDEIASRAFGQRDYSLRRLTFSLDEVEYPLLDAMHLSYVLRLQRGLPEQSLEEWEMRLLEKEGCAEVQLIPFSHARVVPMSKYILSNVSFIQSFLSWSQRNTLYMFRRDND